MSLSKPTKLDRIIFRALLPIMNPWPPGRWLALLIYIVTINVCIVPCLIYISSFFNKKFISDSMLHFQQSGAFFCFLYIALLTYVCYRSEYIHDHFPPMVWISVILTLLFFIMFILLATHKTYGLSKDDVDAVLEAFKGIVGITKELSNDDYTGKATTIEDIENNLKILQNDLQNKKDVSEDISTEMDQIDDLINSVKKNLQEQIDALNKELENDPDQEEREKISEKVDSLKETMGNLDTYYKNFQPYRNKNKGNIFILIIFILFLPIYLAVFVTDVGNFLMYAERFY